VVADDVEFPGENAGALHSNANAVGGVGGGQ